MTVPPKLPPATLPSPPDPRLNAWRPDLADVALKGKVSAPAYVEGERRQVAWPLAPLRRQPSPTAGLDTELLFGEIVRQFDEAEGWAWVQSERDRYVGYVPASALQAQVRPITHQVVALATFVYPIADIKAPALTHLSLGSGVVVDDEGDRFSRLASGGYVVNRHLAEVSKPARDFVEIAERFIGTPYLWGGRSRLGIDCSGLLQLSMIAAGRLVPRDSYMQEIALGRPLKIEADREGLQRGDLVFWKGHVGIMVDGVLMVHANAHHMAVTVETIAEAEIRIAKAGGGPVTSFRRMSAGAAAKG